MKESSLVTLSIEINLLEVAEVWKTRCNNSRPKTLDANEYPKIKEFNIEKVYETEQWKRADIFRDNSDIIKDWANLVHFSTIYRNSLDENDLKSLLNFTPNQKGIEVGTDKALEAKDVLAVFRGNGKFDKNPDSSEFQFQFKFSRELEDGRILVYSIELCCIVINFQLEEEPTPPLFY